MTGTPERLLAGVVLIAGPLIWISTVLLRRLRERARVR